MKKLLLSGVLLMFGFTVTAQDLPTNAEPGKCYVRCKTPEVWKNEDVTVEVSPAYEKIVSHPAEFRTVKAPVISKTKGKKLVVVPATYKTETVNIVCQAPGKRLEVVPAVYQYKDVPVVVQPESSTLEVIPAVYKSTTETVVVEEASEKLTIVPATWGTESTIYRKKEFGTKITVIPASFQKSSESFEVKSRSAAWQMSDRAPDCESSDPNDCRYWCYKEVPAKFNTINKTVLVNNASITRENDCNDPDCGQAKYTRRVMLTPPTVRKTPIPQRTKEIIKTELVTPATTRKVTIPAVTKMVKAKVLVTPATTREVSIPEITKSYVKKTLVSPATTREIEIPEETKMVSKTVLVKDSWVEKIPVAAKTKTVTKEILVSKGGLTTWKSVDCELIENTPLPINWNTASSTLTPAARRTIDARLLPVLKEGVSVVVESHTDSRGDNYSNQSLSDRRAKAVVDYLISKGVNGSQLTAKGFGENKLTNRCADGVSCNEREHAANRRTTFRVINQ